MTTKKTPSKKTAAKKPSTKRTTAASDKVDEQLARYREMPLPNPLDQKKMRQKRRRSARFPSSFKSMPLPIFTMISVLAGMAF